MGDSHLSRQASQGTCRLPWSRTELGSCGREEGSAACPEAAVVSHLGRQACQRQWPGMESLG